METAKIRLLKFLTFLQVGQNTFEKQVGIANGYISHNKGSIGSDVINKISNAFPELDTYWLISGKGEMLKNNQTNENINGNTGIVGNNVNGGGINDTAVMNEIVKMLNKKDEQIDRLLSLLEERKTNAK